MSFREHNWSWCCFYILAACGFGREELDHIARHDMAPTCASLIPKLETDDRFWREVVERARPVGEIDLTVENLPKVAEACRKGSWRKEYWAMLREHHGEAGVEDAVKEVAARRDWHALIGIYTGILNDTKRAAQLLLEHDKTGFEVLGPRDRVTREVAAMDPALAAALLIQEAGFGLQHATREVYLASANRLKDARRLLDMDEHHRAIWAKEIADFRQRHADEPRLIAMLDKSGL